MTSARHIRPLAIAIVRRGGEILVSEARDETKNETFCRPIGGGIEFGEQAIAALRREFQEELAAELTGVELLGVLENIFTAFGEAGHEIVFVFTAEFADPSWLERQDLGTVIDESSPVRWRSLQDFSDGRAILYPGGLLDLLKPV